MTARLNPYLAFRGTAQEAMEFYASVFGGELNVMRFSDMGGMGVSEEEQGWVMHSDLIVEDNINLMGSDWPTSMPGEPQQAHVALSGSAEDEERLRGWWDALSEGGEITMPLNKAPWGDHFGQLVDRYGHEWMFNISGA